MIIRIVKMTVSETRVEEFKKLVLSIRQAISDFKGCRHLDILQDIDHPGIFFSYSQWESAEDLENYRRSDFFKETWPQVARFFKERPRAWSTKKL